MSKSSESMQKRLEAIAGVPMITDSQIKALRREASRAGDRVACVVCDAALGLDIAPADLVDRYDGGLDAQEAHNLEALNLAGKEPMSLVEAARAQVAEWIADAKASHDRP